MMSFLSIRMLPITLMWESSFLSNNLRTPFSEIRKKTAVSFTVKSITDFSGFNLSALNCQRALLPGTLLIALHRSHYSSKY